MDIMNLFLPDLTGHETKAQGSHVTRLRSEVLSPTVAEEGLWLKLVWFQPELLTNLPYLLSGLRNSANILINKATKQW